MKIVIGICISIILGLSGTVYHYKTLLDKTEKDVQELNFLLNECKGINVELNNHVQKQNEAINNYVQKNIILNKKINDSVKEIKIITLDYENKLKKLQTETITYTEQKCDPTILYKDKSEWMNNKWKELFKIKDDRSKER